MSTFLNAHNPFRSAIEVRVPAPPPVVEGKDVVVNSDENGGIDTSDGRRSVSPNPVNPNETDDTSSVASNTIQSDNESNHDGVDGGEESSDAKIEERKDNGAKNETAEAENKPQGASILNTLYNAGVRLTAAAVSGAAIGALAALAEQTCASYGAEYLNWTLF